MGITKIKLKQIEKITSSNVNNAIEGSAIPASKLLAYNEQNQLTDQELRYLVGVTSAIQTQLDAKLPKSVLKKSTDSIDWTSDLIAVTAKAIAAKITSEIAAAQIGGAMVYKGAWSGHPSTGIKAGFTYCYDSGTAPTGHTVEAGDMIIAAVDDPVLTTAANWTVVQANINGAVTYVGNAVASGGIVLFDGTTGKLIKGTSLNGLLKLVNGVPAAATASDLPSHTHDKSVHLNNGSTASGTFSSKIDFKAGKHMSVAWDNTKKSLTIASTISVSNGTAQSGKYVSGMSISDAGVITLTFANKPVYVFGAKPTVTPDGTNKIFYLPNRDIADVNNLAVYVNGIRQLQGTDYTATVGTFTDSANNAASTKIEFTTNAYIPESDDNLTFDYLTANISVS